jgi:hypothetical protein
MDLKHVLFVIGLLAVGTTAGSAANAARLSAEDDIRVFRVMFHITPNTRKERTEKWGTGE